MNFRIIMKNHAADSKIRSRLKIGFRADGTQGSNPTAWEFFVFSKKLSEKGHMALTAPKYTKILILEKK